MTDRRLRVAWFSPHPEHEPGSTSGYVTEQLFPLLSEKIELDLYTDTFEPYKDYKTLHYLKAVREHERQPYDLFFYQIEDKPCADFIRFHLGLMPGIVWFHDIFLSTAGPVPILNSPWRDTIAKYRDHDAAWPDRRKEHDYNGPLAERELALSLCPLFSREVAHTEYQRQKQYSLDTDESYFLPIPVELERKKGERSADEPLRLGIVGPPRIEYRIAQVLDTLSGFDSDSYQLLWIAPEEDKEQIERLLERYPGVTPEIVWGMEPNRWAEQLPELDLALHLQFSVFGHQDPYLGMSLVSGTRTAVLHFGVNDNLPENLVYKIQPGESEGRELAALIKRLFEERNRVIPELASYGRERHDRLAIAEELHLLFQHLAAEDLSEYSPAFARWRALQDVAMSDLLSESQQLMGNHGLEDLLAGIYTELGWEER